MAINFRTNLYNYLSDYLVERGNSPSFAEMIEAMGISPRSKSLITRSLRILQSEGKVILQKEGRRLLIFLSSTKIPLLGRISAGSPIEAFPEYQFLDLKDLFQQKDRFALQVKGNSMVDEGILNGDVIICRQTDTANEGDIVVALIDQQNTTLKRISFAIKGVITLVPANPELKPRAYAPERIRVQGIYVGLIRVSR